MGFAEKINFLESQITELDNQLKQTTSALEQSLLSSDAVEQITKDHYDVQSYKMYMALQKQVYSNTLEYCRLNSDIIRKISVSPSDKINEKIISLEKCFREHEKYADALIKLSSEPANEKEFDKKFIELRDKNVLLIKQGPQLIETILSDIQICRNCIKDCIEKIKS